MVLWRTKSIYCGVTLSIDILVSPIQGALRLSAARGLWKVEFCKTMQEFKELA